MDDGNTKTPKEDIRNVYLQYHTFFSNELILQQGRFVPPSYINHVFIAKHTVCHCKAFLIDIRFVKNVLRIDKIHKCRVCWWP